MADYELSIDEVRKFIADNGGKVTNHELVKHFKKHISFGDNQAEARLKFKDLVNSVASIKQEDGVKYLVLKKNHIEDEVFSNSAQDSSNGFHNWSRQSSATSVDSTPKLIHSNTDPCLTSSRGSSVSSDGPWSTDLPPGRTPQPPPRRKNSRNADNRGAKFAQSVKQLSEEKENMESPRTEEIKEIVSPGSVKEKAQKLNRMASEVDLSQKTVPSGPLLSSVRRRDHKSEKNNEDDDTCSVSTTDPRRREWCVLSARSDYHGLTRLLREDSKFANCKDFNNYTALHWAANHGNLDVIKLMAGTHKVDPNMRTSGGYTALHLAGIHQREEIMEILIHTYGADPLIRDYSGKRPYQYLRTGQAERFISLFPQIGYNGTHAGNRAEKEVGLHRIGSLNSKVKKTSAMFSGGKALTRMKSWGSADNIRERNLMPPPKFFPKRKKSRKQTDFFEYTDNNKGRSGDSDSDSTPANT